MLNNKPHVVVVGSGSRHKNGDGNVCDALRRIGKCGVVVKGDHGSVRAAPADFLDETILVACRNVQVYGRINLVPVVHGFR